MRLFIFAILLLVFGVWLGPTAVENTQLVIAIIIGLFFLGMAITNFQTALMLLLFIIPLSVQVNVTSKGGAPIDLGIDDFFIFCVFLTWLVYISKTQQSPFVSNPLTIPFIAYFAACLVSFLPLVVSGKGNLALSTLHLVKWYEYVFIYFVLVRSLETRDQIVKFTYLTVGSCVLIAVIQFFQILIGIAQGEGMHYFKWATASFESNGILGAYYLFFLSIVTSFIVTTQTLKIRVFLLAIGGLLSFTLFYTFARGAYLGMVVALGALGVLHRKKIMISALLLLLMIPAFTSKNVSERVTMTINVDQTRMKGYYGNARQVSKYMEFSGAGGKIIHLDASSAERLYNWVKARRVINQDPLFGMGYWSGRFVGVFGFTTAHNNYLTILVETGIFGLLTFLWIACALLWSSVKFGAETLDPFYSAISKGLAAGYFGVLVHAFFGESFESFRLTGPIWIMAGIVFAARKVYREQEPYYQSALTQNS